MYVAVKGGEKAIDHAHNLLAHRRRGDTRQAALSVAQIREQMKLAVDRVMTEGSVYDPELAALAVKQASGDLMEAIFLLRAYRTTLPRLAVTSPVNTGDMLVQRRISATFKDVPGGQVLGSTYDYTHRLLDFKLLAEGEAESDATDRASSEEPVAPDESVALCPRVLEMLNSEGLIESAKPESEQPGDLTREPLDYPADRATRLQALARGDEGFLLALAYSTQRGYGRNHPFAGEIRQGYVAVEIVPEELGFAIDIGDIELTECEMINQFVGSKDRAPQFTRGYGLGFGQCERKAMAMALVDRSLRAGEFDEERDSPAQNEEFVLSHCDNVESNGFVSHLKLPHYVDFQSELELLRKLRKEFEEQGSNRPAAKAKAATASEVTS
ncbi:carbon-phosphorus lyase complex subunit PhnI [Marinobacter sp. 1Y8]